MGEQMKSKVIQIILLCFIVMMLGGILSSIKGNNKNDEITTLISEFDEKSEYEVTGYIDNNQINEENENIICRFNSSIGEVVSKIVNGSIDFLFEIVKKIVS